VTVTEPYWYDTAMTEPGAPSMLPLAQSPWRPLYAEAARWIAPSSPVVDLGCGTGRFADELRNHGRQAPFLGLDFSPATIAEARSYAGTDGIEFEVADLRNWVPDDDRPGGTVYTCLEVLEHLEDDLGLVARVPPGHELVFSVPNYPSKAHLRTFGTLAEIWARYGCLVTFRRWSMIELDDRKAIHLLDTTRRLEAW
jgi:trans-aconitate methyltransferase